MIFQPTAQAEIIRLKKKDLRPRLYIGKWYTHIVYLLVLLTDKLYGECANRLKVGRTVNHTEYRKQSTLYFGFSPQLISVQ